MMRGAKEAVRAVLSALRHDSVSGRWSSDSGEGGPRKDRDEAGRFHVSCLVSRKIFMDVRVSAVFMRDCEGPRWL